MKKIDQSLDRIRSSIQNYSITNICKHVLRISIIFEVFIGRETSIKANWPKITDIRKLDRMIDNLRRHEYTRFGGL